jgi:hypothetical protein
VKYFEIISTDKGRLTSAKVVGICTDQYVPPNDDGSDISNDELYGEITKEQFESYEKRPWVRSKAVRVYAREVTVRFVPIGRKS